MKHNFFRKNIIKFIDTDYKGKEKLQFMDHIDKCNSCKKDYDFIRFFWEISYPNYEVPDSLKNRIYNTINGKETKKSYIQYKPSLSFQLLFILLLIFSISFGAFFSNSIFVKQNKDNKRKELVSDYLPSQNTLSNFVLQNSEGYR